MNLIRIKAFPDASRDHIEEVSPKVLRVFVRDSAQNNMANKAVIRSVAAFYSLAPNRLRLVSGHRKQAKIIRILEPSSVKKK